jgi:hypothetical protein
MTVLDVAVCSNRTKETVAYTALSAPYPAPLFKREIPTIKPPAVFRKSDGLTLPVIQVVKTCLWHACFQQRALFPVSLC